MESKTACQKVKTLRISQPRRVVFHGAGRRRLNFHLPGEGLLEVLPATGRDTFVHILERLSSLRPHRTGIE
jgi:hypothetical protein